MQKLWLGVHGRAQSQAAVRGSTGAVAAGTREFLSDGLRHAMETKPELPFPALSLQLHRAASSLASSQLLTPLHPQLRDQRVVFIQPQQGTQAIGLLNPASLSEELFLNPFPSLCCHAVKSTE